MQYRKASIGIIAIIIIAGMVSYNAYERIALFALSKFYSLEISYKSLIKDKQNGLVFENLRVTNKKMGLGFYSKHASLKPVRGANFLKTINFDFKFKDVHFIKNRKEVVKTRYDTLSELAAMPFEGRWTYKEISGVAEIFSNGLTLKNFAANGKDIRLTLSGDIFYNNIVDVEISIYFSKDVLKDIPAELHSVIMKDEPNEWKSFSVKLKGDMNSPSVQISGKLFRLNIGTMVVNN